jgi:hypothetical protein
MHTEPEQLDVHPDDRLLICADGNLAVVNPDHRDEQGKILCKRCEKPYDVDHEWSVTSHPNGV